MILVFDTETNGLPKDWKAPVDQVDNWPRIIQIAWQQYTPDGRKIAEHNYLIKPNGFELTQKAQDVNKITKEMLEKDGISIEHALKMLQTAFEITTKLVAHNIHFDKKVVQAEFLRMSQDRTVLDKMHEIEKICTMNSSTKFCNIPGPYGLKWPKLEELYEKLHPGEEITSNLHDALVDVSVTADCYFELKKRGIITA